MSRPPASGLRYAPWDVGVLENSNEIDKLVGSQGSGGFMVYFALGQYSELCVGHWKRKKVQVEQPVLEAPPVEEPADVAPPAPAVTESADEPTAPEPPADTVPETHVESGRFGQLRNSLSGKPADLEDTAWDEHLVWRKEPPVEDVQAVVMVGYKSVYGNAINEVRLGWWDNRYCLWYQDEKRALRFSSPILGWFKVPEWEE